MIPKTLHYCWLSGEPLPPRIERYMKSWREVMPDYRIKLWSMKEFDIDSVPFVRDACKVRQWASAADFIRLWALYNEGGVYLDSDVVALRSFDPFLGHEFFSSVEHHPGRDGRGDTNDIQAAVFGSVAGHPYLRDCMEYFHTHDFIHPDGSYDNQHIIAPRIMANAAVKYGYLFENRMQHLDAGIEIYPSDTFVPSRDYEITANSYAVHKCMGSWHIRPWYKRMARKLIEPFQ